MIINYSTSDFTLNSGSYYSPAFLQDNEDNMLSVGVTLASGTVSIQSSINGTNWSDVADTQFTVTTFGIQSYSEGQKDLLYRLKCSAQPTSAQILI